MKTKLLLCLVGICVAATDGARAQTTAPAAPAPDPSLSWVVTPSLVSQYMFRGVRLSGPSFEPAVELSYAELTAGVWANYPMKDKVPGVSDPEYDFYGSYTYSINDTISVAAGYTWYSYPRAIKAAGSYRSTFEPNLAVNFTIPNVGIKLTPKFYYNLRMSGPTGEVTALYALPLKQYGTELDFTATVGSYMWKAAAAYSTPGVKNWGDYWLAGVAAPFQLSKRAKLIVGWAYTKGANNYFKQASSPRTSNSSAVGRSVVTLGCAFSF